MHSIISATAGNKISVTAGNTNSITAINKLTLATTNKIKQNLSQYICASQSNNFAQISRTAYNCLLFSIFNMLLIKIPKQALPNICLYNCAASPVIYASVEEKSNPHIYLSFACDHNTMSERKPWTLQEDSVLRLLKHERNIKKWSSIARLMLQEFGLRGRSGKQCRQRYCNHLDGAIVSFEWTEEEREVLLAAHREVGNRWAQIAQKLTGRSENQVKNYFYSRLRKAMRILNKFIESQLTPHKPFKLIVVSKLMTAAQSRFNENADFDETMAEFGCSIMQKLFLLQKRGEQPDVAFAKSVIEDIENFKAGKKTSRLRREFKQPKQAQSTDHLKPPPKMLRKISASLSSPSAKSDEKSSSFLPSSSSFLSFNGCFSWTDLNQLDELIKPEAQEKSMRKTSGNNSSDMSQYQHPEHKECSVELMENKIILQPDFFQGSNGLVMDQNQLYERQKLDERDNMHEKDNMREMAYDMMCDQSPHTLRIIQPKQFPLSFCPFQKREGDNDGIQSKQELDRMEFE